MVSRPTPSSPSANRIILLYSSAQCWCRHCGFGGQDSSSKKTGCTTRLRDHELPNSSTASTFKEVRASCRASLEVRASLALLLALLPLAAGTISVTPVPLSATSKTVNAIDSLVNSTWAGTGLGSGIGSRSGSGSGMEPSDRPDNRFLASIARSLPPPSFHLETDEDSPSLSTECNFHFGRSAPSGCSDTDTDTDSRPNPTGRRLQEEGRGGKKKKKLLKKWALPLLIGYKLKFLVLVPLLFATLALLVASTGFAGFFFAMFTAAIALPKSGGHYGR